MPKQWNRKAKVNMDGKNYQKGYHVGRISRGVKEKPWSHDDLNVLQLDLFDRTVVKIAGEWVTGSLRVDYIARRKVLIHGARPNRAE